MLEHFDRQVRTAATYTTVITGVGYAGLIAIWSGLRFTIGRFSVLATALLIGISLLSFIALELTKAAGGMKAQRLFQEIVAQHYGEPDFVDYMIEGNAKIIKETETINRYWPASFWVSAVTGVAAALWIMIAAFVGLASR